MGVSARHILNHGPTLAVLGRTVLSGLRPPSGAVPSELPGPEITETMPPLPQALLDDFVREVGGEPRTYRGQVPPHLFSQWAFPMAARTFGELPYPMIKAVNGGCRMEVNAPLPVGEPLTVTARLLSIDDDGRRVVMGSRVTTSTPSVEDALIAEFYAIVPLPKKPSENGSPGKSNGKPKDKPTVPDDAHELMRQKLPRNAGLSFAKLTGDFNPIHWIGPYAKASGFRDVILHGFATQARAVEGLVRQRLGGDPSALRVIDVKFTRPLVLPHDVGLYQQGDRIFMGDAPGGPAYMTGTFETEKRP